MRDSRLMRYLLGHLVEDLPRHEGRVDFRRSNLVDGESPRSALSRPGALRRIEIKNVDVTHSNLDRLWLEGCSVTNVRFDRNTLSSVLFKATIFSGCSFDHAKFSRSIISTADSPVTFEDCTFSGARLRGEVVDAATFRRCEFSRTDLDDTCFYACTFESCRFAGDLSFTRFAGRPRDASDPRRGKFSGVSFVDSKFKLAEFPGMDLTLTELPDDPRIVRVRDYGPALLQLQLEYSEKSGRDAELILRKIHAWRESAEDGTREGIVDIGALESAGLTRRGAADLVARLEELRRA